MRLVVTGAAGFVGSVATSMLLDAGHSVVGIDAFVDVLYPASDKRARARSLEGAERLTLVEADLTAPTLDLEGLVAESDAIIHFAALPGLAPSWLHEADYRRHNTEGTRHVVDAVERSGAFLVHISTSSVYGAIATGDESAPLAPVSPYGESKLEAERIVDRAREAGRIRATTLRLFSVYGPRQRPDMAYARACAAFLTGEPFTVHGDGSQVRSNTYVADAARAAILAATMQPETPVMNIAGGEPIALLDALGVLARELEVEPRLVFGERVAGDQVATTGDASLAARVLGWAPSTALVDGLRAQAAAARSDHEAANRIPRER